ncbi:MAG: hypothetical protein ACLFQL_07600, partial [Paracoccaceae bacterium]
ALALSGCAAGSSIGQGDAGEPVRQVSVARGTIEVTGPPGYCIDPAALRDGPRDSFVLLASCAILGGDALIGAEPAILTVTVSEPNPEAAPPRAADLAAAVGGARVLDTQEAGPLSLVHLDGGGDALLPGGDSRHWRGATRLGDRVIGLAAYAPEGSRLAGPEGGALLAELSNRVRQVEPPEAEAASGDSAPEDTARPRLGAGWLRGLFN